MPDFAEPVSLTFITITVTVIFMIIGIGIFAVQKFKKDIS